MGKDAFLRRGWLHVKIRPGAGCMTVLHGMLARYGKRFRRRPEPRIPQKFYRIINEIPTVLLIAIVILVVVKPF